MCSRFSFSCWSVVVHVFSVVVHVFSVVVQVLVSCFSRVGQLSLTCSSVVFHVFVSCLSPAKLLKLSCFVLIPTHLFRTFAGSKAHFFLFSQDGNVTHNTHNIHHFTENQALGSQHSHNKPPTRSQHLTTLPQETRKCCELL